MVECPTITIIIAVIYILIYDDLFTEIFRNMIPVFFTHWITNHKGLSFAGFNIK